MWDKVGTVQGVIRLKLLVKTRIEKSVVKKCSQIDEPRPLFYAIF